MTIAVVVPYYQKKPGLLEAALRSIVGQSVNAPIRVVVVDDASPLPADAEVARVPTRDGVAIDVIRQANGGPAAARNRGLDALGPEVTQVAFLDSDDTWADDHLRRAAAALAAGHDFYFSDHVQPGQTVSAFARAGRIDVARHPAIEAGSGLYRYAGDMFDQIITGNVIGTSTVVYDFTRLRDRRFDEAFYSAGEDYLFWIACARAGARFCFSSAVEALYGVGVNVYAGSGWGTEGFMRRVQNEMRYRKRLLTFPLTDDQRRFVEQKIAKLRTEYADDVVHRVSHRKPLTIDMLRSQLKVDVRTLVELPIHMGQIVARRIRGHP